jgi:hypothetical protein
MKGYKYISIWRDTNFWQNILKGISFCLGLILFVGSFFSNFNYIWYSSIFFLAMLFHIILATIDENTPHETHFLRNKILFRSILVICISVIIILSIESSQNINQILFLLAVLFVFYTLLLAVFKEQLVASGGILKYLFSDKPSLFSKRYFHEAETHSIIINGVFYASIIGFIIWYCATRL